jgi:GGDEF domain-containing protein
VEKSIVTPLSLLRIQLRRVRDDKQSLGEEVVLQSHPEIQSLASDFNAMSLELKKMYQSLETMAYTDPLTKLANRSQLGRSLEYYVYLNQQQKTPFALFLMDLNRFKSVNDMLGHHAGDDLLQQVSQRLRQALRKSDIVAAVTSLDTNLFQNDTLARMGGDEFAAVLPSVANVEDAFKIAKKVLDEMRAPFTTKGHSFVIGISIGIVLCPMHGRDPVNLMHRADVAMYKAKNNNLGCCVFSDDLDETRI